MKRATKRSGRAAKPVPLAQQLDKAVDRIMTDRESKRAQVNSRIAAILRIALDLRDLPNQDFKARLKKDLVARVTPASATVASAPRIHHAVPVYRRRAWRVRVVPEGVWRDRAASRGAAGRKSQPSPDGDRRHACDAARRDDAGPCRVSRQRV